MGFMLFKNADDARVIANFLDEWKDNSTVLEILGG